MKVDGGGGRRDNNVEGYFYPARTASSGLRSAPVKTSCGVRGSRLTTAARVTFVTALLVIVAPQMVGATNEEEEMGLGDVNSHIMAAHATGPFFQETPVEEDRRRSVAHGEEEETAEVTGPGRHLLGSDPAPAPPPCYSGHCSATQSDGACVSDNGFGCGVRRNPPPLKS